MGFCVSERGFCCLVGLLFCKDHQLLLVHLGTREGEPGVGPRSWSWMLKETKIKVDKRVSKGFLISLFCFMACSVWVCACVFFYSRLLCFSGFQSKGSVSPSGVWKTSSNAPLHLLLSFPQLFRRNVRRQNCTQTNCRATVSLWLDLKLHVLPTAEPLTPLSYSPRSPGVNLLVLSPFRHNKQENHCFH